MRSDQSLRVILVDDDSLDRENVQRLLGRSELEARIEELSTAQRLLDLHDLSGIDCILLDYRLPDSDGLTLLRRLLAEEPHTMPAVIVLTGEGNERLAAEAIKGGADDYLNKGEMTSDSLVRSIRNAMERKRLRVALAQKTRDLRRLSLYDELSGLPNRNLYLERLEQAVRTCRRSGESFALLVMDLVAFKEVNDSLGHPAGDRLISIIGRRFALSCRDSDTIARIGGDEFAAILTATGNADGAIIAAQKIETAVSEAIALQEGLVQVGISIGIALYPEHGEDPESLYRNADTAMYQAKRQGRGHVLYHPETCAPVPPSVVLAGQLSEAIELDQLTLHYQPKVDMRSGRYVGAEALVRWDRPGLGILPPAEFVPRIERTAMIEPLTRTVLGKALRQVALWRSKGLSIPVAINLSARLLDDDSLPGMIAAALERHDIRSEMLTLEITETGLMTNLLHAGELLRRIKQMGVRISIDDFGTGYTSLRSLMSLPLSEIKVDKIFVDGVCSSTMESAIVASIVEISRGFDITVVAEGVEGEEAWAHLTEIGCHQGQGFLIAKPMTADDLESWIDLWGREPYVQERAH